jgi:hypothetical protein
MMSDPAPQKDVDLSLLASIIRTWTPGETAELDQWKQGDIIACTGFAWLPAANADPPILAATHAIITSQTCDIIGTGPGARHPFVQVSPLVDVTGIDAGKWGSLSSGAMLDRYGLEPAELPGQWIVDLRVSTPMPKEQLLGQKPIPGFRDERGALRFAEHLADRVRRPALHDFLTEVVTREIDAEVAKGKRARPSGWCDKVDEVCFLIRGDRLQPTSFRLLVLPNSTLLPEEHQRWVDLSKAFEKRAKRFSIKVEKQSILRYGECTAAIYRDAVPVRIPELGSPRG